MTTRRLLLALAVALFLWNVWGYDLWAPDEPYFGEGAREMVADGRWVVPHVNGVVSTDKPPLFFWLIAVFSLPFQDVSPLTARLPSVLAALGSLWLVIRLGRRLYNDRVATLAGSLLVVTFLFWDKARTAQTDAVLSFFILVSLAAFAAFRSGDASPRKAGLLFWTAAALAVLTKGPVGILLPLGVAVLTLGFDRRLSQWRHFAPLSGPLVFAAILACWVVPASLWNPELYSVWESLKEHFVDRGMHGMHHAQPFWYYARALPPLLFPWAALVPGAILCAWRQRDEADRFLLVIVIFIVVFFSISTEKRTLYVLPSFPAYALLLARMLDSVLSGQGAGGMSRRWVSVPQSITAGILLLVGLTLIGFGGTVDEVPRWMTAALGVLMAAAGAATAWSVRRGALGRSIGWTWAGTAAVYLFTATAIFPALNGVKSSREFAQRIVQETAASRAAGNDVVSFGLRNLPEAFAFHGKGLYTRETDGVHVLAEHLRRPARVWAVIDIDRTGNLPADAAERMTTVAAARLSRKNVALVHNGVEAP